MPPSESPKPTPPINSHGAKSKPPPNKSIADIIILLFSSKTRTLLLHSDFTFMEVSKITMGFYPILRCLEILRTKPNGKTSPPSTDPDLDTVTLQLSLMDLFTFSEEK